MLNFVNIKLIISAAFIFFATVILLLTNSACSGRNTQPVILEDSTIVFTTDPAKDVVSSITLTDRINRNNGKIIRDEIDFTIKDKAKLHALVFLKNPQLSFDKDQMFHMDWIDPAGKSFYIKRIDIQPNDSSFSLLSSISITADRRQPGDYKVRVYWFRELIAEKTFRLSTVEEENIMYEQLVEKLKTEIDFYKGISKKTELPFGKGNEFTIKNKSKVQAIINISGIDTTFTRKFVFTSRWIGPDESSFYKKEFNSSPGESVITATSSISISPEKRTPGKYRLEVYLSDRLIAAENFELIKPVEEKKKILPTINKGTVTAEIILCRKVNKETGKPSGIDSVFTIKDKASVKAIVNFENKDTLAVKHYEIYLNWVDSKGKSFYKKQFILSADSPEFSISNSISIVPEKRKPGNYILKVFIFKELVAAKNFTLVRQTE